MRVHDGQQRGVPVADVCLKYRIGKLQKQHLDAVDGHVLRQKLEHAHTAFRRPAVHLQLDATPVSGHVAPRARHLARTQPLLDGQQAKDLQRDTRRQWWQRQATGRVRRERLGGSGCSEQLRRRLRVRGHRARGASGSAERAQQSEAPAGHGEGHCA